MRPKSSSATLICRRALVRIQPFSTGTSYVLPVRLSVIVSVSLGMGGDFTGRGSLSTKKNDESDGETLMLPTAARKYALPSGTAAARSRENSSRHTQDQSGRGSLQTAR